MTNDFIQVLDVYLDAIRADYFKWNEHTDPTINREIIDNSIREFNAGLKIHETTLYYKVSSRNSVHSFIVKADGPKFKRGDILKAAGYNVPAKNQARGNLFTGYRIRWTGAEYLR